MEKDHIEQEQKGKGHYTRLREKWDTGSLVQSSSQFGPIIKDVLSLPPLALNFSDM